MDRFKTWEYPEFDEENMTKWNWMCQHHQKLKLGNKVDIGAFTYINAKYGVIIEDNVQIGSHCSIYSYSSIDDRKGKVVIKKNARICTHSTIMPGVTIGENSIVGAYSFVNKDVPDNTLVHGIPIKITKKI